MFILHIVTDMKLIEVSNVRQGTGLNQEGMKQQQEIMQHSVPGLNHQMRMCPESIHNKFNTLLRDQIYYCVSRFPMK